MNNEPRGGAAAQPISSAWSHIRPWLTLLRLEQYSKNLLVFVPVFASHSFSISAITSAAIAFMAFCICASSVYVANDIADLQADRLHPRKRRRPLPAGTITLLHAKLSIPVLVILGLTLGATISWAFVLILLAYLCLSNAYSLWLKRKVMIEVVVLSILYTIRVLGGAVAIMVVPSPWLLAFCIFIFTGLALIKRYSELAMRHDICLNHPMNRAYEVNDMALIGAMAAAAGFNAVTLFALYIASDAVTPLYSRPWMLWLICPLLIYGFGRMLLLAHRRIVDDDPLVFALRDRTSLRIVALIIAIVLAAI